MMFNKAIMSLSFTSALILFIGMSALLHAEHSVGNTMVGQQNTSVASSGPAELTDVEILYFYKFNDNKVIGTLKRSGIAFSRREAEAPVIESETNVITCTPDVDAAAIKKIAYMMLRNGVNIKAIEPSIYGRRFINRITLESYSGFEGAPTLSIEVIDGLTSCPAREVAMPMPSSGSKARVRLSSDASAIVGCYSKLAKGGRVVTIRQLYQCSGLWVTPRALMACSLAAHCPALPDTIWGRSTLDSVLKESKITVDSPLLLRAEVIPRLPDRAAIEACKDASSTAGRFTQCAASSVSGQFQSVTTCFAKFTAGEQLACFTALTENRTLTALVGCLGGGRPSRDKVAFCASDKEVRRQVDATRDCITRATEVMGARSCITSRLPANEQTVATCFLASSASSDPIACLDAVSSDVSKARHVIGCLESTTDQSSRLACIRPHLGGKELAVSACLSETQKVAIGICLLGDSVQTRSVQHAYSCFRAGRSISSLVANCASGIMDQKSQQTIACIADGRDDRRKLASCAAGALLPAEASRLVGCASDNTGPVSFALCATAPAMSEEWRIAAECAVNSGGEPISFVSCTGGRLTIRELTKCFTGEIGKDCFGPNNTIVVALENAYSDITQGPGANNEVVKAIRVIGELTGGPNSVINNPGQIWGGSNSIFNNPEQIFGGSGSVFNDPGQFLDPSRWVF